MPEPLTRETLDGVLSAFELRLERRLGTIDGDLREIKARMVNRDGPLMDELRNIEVRVSGLESQLADLTKKNGILSRSEVMQLARDVVTDTISGGRTSSDYTMRIAMFAISIGTLIFVTKGGV